MRCCHANLKLAGRLIWVEAAGDRAAIGIGDRDSASAAIEEGRSRARNRRQKMHDGALDGIAVFVFHADHWLLRPLKPDVIDRSVAFQDDDFQDFSIREAKGEDRKEEESAPREHRIPPGT